ncbi:MAG TPA: histidine kinase dimerization/phospho-acceptor domain-containing protein, partial [Pyrinomonadaceae bacterium]|nr:histidine kinase dimerization/phospho-acceptor domain-containing protein [Pyrinomonadaceae bacterium]
MSRRLIFLLLAAAALLAAFILQSPFEARQWVGLLCALVAGLALSFLPRGAAANVAASAASSPSSSPPLRLTEDVRFARADEIGGVGRPSSAPASALLEATMNGMREGVLVVDQSLRVVASNRAARDIFSHVGGRLELLRLAELTRNSSIHAAFTAAINDHERAEVRVETRGADRRMLELRVEPLRLDDGAGSRGAIGVFFDITQLERLERVRQEFLSNVSHELRTPLTAILAFVETLEEGAMDDAENNRRFLGVIRKNATRMHNLIDDILELSAIEAGTVAVEPEQVRLQPIVGDVLTALAARADAREVCVQNEVGAETMVYADSRRLEQMLTNLVDNAIKFNRPGGQVMISHAQKI